MATLYKLLLNAAAALSALFRLPGLLLFRARPIEWIVYEADGAMGRGEENDGLLTPLLLPAGPKITSLSKLRHEFGFLSSLPPAPDGPRGILLQIGHLRCSLPILLDLREMLLALRDTGLEVVVWAESLDQRSYWLASAASQVWLSPRGRLELTGFAAAASAGARPLRKLGVSVEIIRAGRFKSAGELVGNDEVSEQQVQQLDELIGDLATLFAKDVASGRKWSEEALNARVDQGPYSAKAALNAGLVDQLAYADEVRELLAAWPLASSGSTPDSTPDSTPNTTPDAGPAPVALASPTTDSAPTTPSSHPPSDSTQKAAPDPSSDSREPSAPNFTPTSPSAPGSATPKAKREAPARARIAPFAGLYSRYSPPLRWIGVSPRRPILAVVDVEGTITSGRSRSVPGLASTAGSEDLVEILTSLRRNRRVKAVVLRIDSRGGSALASDIIWRAVQRLGEQKTVVAYLDSVAASGGYYIAAGAKHIMASPVCITGSIGVISMRPDVSGLLGKLEIDRVVVSRGARAGVYRSDVPLSDDMREALQRDLLATYGDFVEVVASGRNLSEERVRELGEGRVFLSTRAKDLALVDSLGSFDEAVALAQRLSKSPIPLRVLRKASRQASYREMLRQWRRRAARALAAGLLEDSGLTHASPASYLERLGPANAALRHQLTPLLTLLATPSQQSAKESVQALWAGENPVDELLS